MATEPLRIFDPRRNFQLQGFTGRGATTTLHDASATGVSISGIFQAAEDFAVLGLYNAYDYFNHLRLKHLPRTNLSGLTLAFDIEYGHDLDGAMRFDAAKYPSVSWDAMTFICGAGTPRIPTRSGCSTTPRQSAAARPRPHAPWKSPARRSSTAESTGSIYSSAILATR